MQQALTAHRQVATENRVVKSILVVDDSLAQRKILMAILGRWGYRVLEAASGAEALEVCDQLQPDLVISDWLMPGMSGLEFCLEFKSMPRDKYGYFILVTSKSGKEDIAKGLDAGADDFVTKPVDPSELRARIAAGDRILRMERELTEKNQMISSTLDEVQRLHDALSKDLLQAKEFQQSLIREHYRDFGAAELSLILRSSGPVGGDLVGMFPIPDGKVGFYGIDVSGHGISSALMTARLAGYLSAGTPDQNIAFRQTETGEYVLRSPAETIRVLNNLVLQEMSTEHYFTLLLAIYDPVDGRVTMSQAGHPYPLVQHACGRVELVGPGGVPVGLIENATYEDFDITLAPGDRVLVYSDGIVEQPDKSGSFTGDGWLCQVMANLAEQRGGACLDAVMAQLEDYAKTKVFEDDASAILLEVKPT